MLVELVQELIHQWIVVAVRTGDRGGDGDAVIVDREAELPAESAVRFEPDAGVLAAARGELVGAVDDDVVKVQSDQAPVAR